MKRFLIVSLGVLFTAALLPQSSAAAVGIKGGFGLSKSSMVGGDITVPLSYLKAPMGGLFFGIGLGPVTIQPEILYVRMGARMQASGSADWVERRIETVQVPLLLKLNLMPGPISPMIYGGPYGACRLSAKDVSYEGGVTSSENIKSQIKSTDYGVVFGGGIDFKLVLIKLSAEVRYNLGLANVAADPAPGFSVKNRTFMFLVGVGF